MLISIAIPAYNRANELCELLESIKRQNRPEIEIIICEDHSPERKVIENKVAEYKKIFPNLKFFKNKNNLGYDGNLRNAIQKSSSDYVFLCGNDDILSENSISVIEEKIALYKPVALLRSYKSFYKKLDRNSKLTVHRYVLDDTLVEADEKELAWMFYRSVFVSGLVIDRKLAKKYATNAVDGMFYYQNFIITQISKHGKVLYVPDFLVYNRLVDYGDFGNAEVEKVTPSERTIESSIHFIKCFFKCAEIAEKKREIKFTNHLKKIASAYSFSVLSYHRDKGIAEFLRYSKNLKKLGYSGPYFFLYKALLIIFGLKSSLVIINFFKICLGRTIRLVK